MEKVIKTFSIIGVLTLIICPFIYNEANVTREVIKAAEDDKPDNFKTTINDYVVYDHFDGMGSYILDISKNNVNVFSISDQHRFFYDGRCIELLGEKGCLPEAGASLQNDGVPGLVIGEWTGGAYCCSKYTILSLGKEFKIIDEIDNGSSALLFKDLDNDGKTELVGRDWYYQEAWVGVDKIITAPVVIWKFIDGKYRICTSLMRKPPPTKKEMEDYALMYKDVVGGTVATGAQGYMLTLVYTGNASLIPEFYDIYSENCKNFHEYYSDKKSFINDFYSVIKQDPYWDEYIQKLFFYNMRDNNNEYNNVDSPDGNYQFSFLKNGEILKNVPDWENKEYDLHLIDKKTKKDVILQKNMCFINSIQWSSDGNWLALHNYMRQYGFISLLNIKSNKLTKVDFWKYIMDNSEKLGIYWKEEYAPYPDIEIVDWSKDGMSVNMEYRYGNGNSGEIVYDLQKSEISGLIPNPTPTIEPTPATDEAGQLFMQ